MVDFNTIEESSNIVVSTESNNVERLEKCDN
jgi:hypothetical protein